MKGHAYTAETRNTVCEFAIPFTLSLLIWNVFSFQSLLSQFRGVAPDYNRYVYCLASPFLLLIQASLCQTRQTGRRGGEKSAKGKIERGRLSQTAAEIGPTKHKVLENLKKSWKYSWKFKNLRTSKEYVPCFIVVFQILASWSLTGDPCWPDQGWTDVCYSSVWPDSVLCCHLLSPI